MELIERDSFLDTLQSEFDNIPEDGGHCIFISGEAGIGKTSLVKAFSKKTEDIANIYLGTCDSLFAPRPLAPVYDILLQLGGTLPENKTDIADHTSFFNRVFQELKHKKGTSLVIFEDIHWADEATLDFVKFLARRISQLRCIFILSYRDNEIHSGHPLRNVMGQLNSGSFTRLQLLPLSRQAVEKMAAEKGYRGEDVYTISGGNPFYVTELLASYNPGIPESIKDSILSAYNRTEEKTRQIWELLSVIPGSFETKYLEKFEPCYASSLENALESRILFIKEGYIFFKHELFRRTIESSLSPLKRISLNKNILNLLRESFEQNGDIERIIHHAKNANEYEIVLRYVPLAARKAIEAGAHIEASRLYLTAIEYYQGNDKDILLQLYESYAYECYLTNQIKEAIIYQGKSLNLRKEKNDIEKTADSMRFLSRLWWYDGNRKKAEAYANDAIELMNDQPSSRTKAMILSNMSQLKMLSYEFDECIAWGEKAFAMAKGIADEEILCHALNNLGTTLARIESSRKKGIELLQQSLQIALKHSYDDHTARVYVNLASNAVKMNDYEFAGKILNEGIQYCEERDLDIYTTYLLAFKARQYLKTGKWNEAYHIAENLIRNEDQPPIVKIEALVVMITIKMRRGDNDLLPLLTEAKEKAFEAMEPQRIIPAVTALLEYEWITGTGFIKNIELEYAITMLSYKGFVGEKSEFGFWLLKAGKQSLQPDEYFEGYNFHTKESALKAADLWKQLGCPYEQALALFEGGEDDKRKAIEIVHNLGANAVYEKLKLEMRRSGIKSIPRGIRKSTLFNPALLTDRELDILQLLHEGLHNKEIASRLFISPKTVDHHISSILFKLDVNSRAKAVQQAVKLEIIK